MHLVYSLFASGVSWIRAKLLSQNNFL
jgi:hypothetical protein